MRATRRYVRTVAAVLLPLWAATASLNLLVDPYAANPGPAIDALDDHRLNSTRAAKAERIARGGWEGLVFGSSVANQGCDPGHPAFDGARVFVAGLPGGNLHEVRTAFDLAMERNDPRLVVFFVDPVMVSRARATLADWEQSKFNPRLRLPEYHLRRLLGWDPTLDSLQVLRDSRGQDPEEARADARGFRRRPPEILLAWGDWARVLRGYFHEEWNRFSYGEDRLDDLRAMLARARAEGARSVVLIPPFHATALEGMRLMGMEEGFDRLRRDLAGIAAAAAADPGPGPPPSAWDFSAWTGPPAEPVPLDGKGVMRMYSDPIHPTEALARRFLSRALGRDDLVEPEFRGFGVRLEPATVEDRIAALRREREAWLRDHAAEAAKVAALHASTAEERARRRRLAGAGE